MGDSVLYIEEIHEDEEGQEMKEICRILDVKTRGVVPAKRGGATLTLIEKNGQKLLFLIGGANRNADMFNDVHVYDIEKSEWIQIHAENSASFQARSGHTAVAIGHLIYVFGGMNLPLQAVYNDVHIFNTDTVAWSQLVPCNKPPPPRNAHVAIAIPKGMVVFGGSSPSEGPMNDVFLLKLQEEQVEWIPITCNGSPVVKRELHAAVLLPNSNSIYISGGRLQDGQLAKEYAVLDTDTWNWQIHNSQWRRCGHVAGVLDGEVVHYGGWDGGNEFCNDCWVAPIPGC
ncbi:hypothetical protein THRCLA_00531 [Thraustotheca clavata]|uniref:Uncharacterized protein n=1 Tax=Thraustotheca clavata TaxID=74557 RepID=A0A1W0AB81_9STRA|nr:hypothetical protein THRCLA_00531 [Thraustotheca clavata]